MQVDDPLVALDFDFAVMVRGIRNEREQTERYSRRGDSMAALAKLKEKCTVEVDSIPFGFN